MSAHDIPPAVDHPSSCPCLICFCLKREQERSGPAPQAKGFVGCRRVPKRLA